ncbi:MAG: hypothetical protein KDB22_29360, partial [Planctomycetales bacterium]|nr:hypothetical protein [Planctomycetales bacterium]
MCIVTYTRRLCGVTPLRQYFHGWVGYFRNGLAKTQLTDLDQWVRRRIRACYWK